MAEAHAYPRLRPVEVFPVEHDGQRMVVMQDPRRLAAGPVTLSPPALFILSLLDGNTSPEQIQVSFFGQFGQRLQREQFDHLIQQMDAALYLDNGRFHQHLESLLAAYRHAPARMCGDERSLGADDDGLGPTLGRLLARNERRRPKQVSGRLCGLISPHLDYDRGQACYADAYGLLPEVSRAERFVILATNHRGMSHSVVATRKDFQSPLGTAATDRAFIDRLADRCGMDLCAHELDHLHEHSVELQVMMLQHVLPSGSFQIVPILCPDPCGPTGTAPYNGEGIDLRQFGLILKDLLEADGVPTVLIAGADLSHVGRHFGDDCELSDEVLQRTAENDNAALQAMVGGGAEPFLQALTAHANSTHVCSAGCIFTLLTALPHARRELLRYHQAVNREHDICVTCCSAVLWEG